MKGVILAGGNGSRLYPLTKITNKHLLPIYNKPMIYYPIQTLVDAGIKDIMIIAGKGYAGQFLELLGSGINFGANFTYEIQNESGGIAQALNIARKFVDNDNVTVILGDNIFENSVKDAVTSFVSGAKIFLKPIKDVNRFGVAEIKHGRVSSIEEKPDVSKSNLAVTGLYIYDAEVFTIINALTPSERGEFEITDVNNEYITNGTMSYTILEGEWSDAGTFDSLLSSGIIVQEKLL